MSEKKQILHTKMIKPESSSFVEYAKEVWNFRSMVWVLAKRDLKIKYAQTLLGVIWSLIQPLTALILYTFFFEILMHHQKQEVPYVLFAFSGIMCWNLFSYIVNSGSTVLMSNQNLISKVYFPKLILHLSKILLGLLDFCIAFTILIALLFIYKIKPSAAIFALPLFVSLVVILGLTISIWLSALSISYRDLYHIVPYLVNFGIWVTPVFFSLTIIPTKILFVLMFNPLAGAIEGFRWCLFGTSSFSEIFFIPFIVTIVGLVFGIMYLSKVEGKLIDKI